MALLMALCQDSRVLETGDDFVALADALEQRVQHSAQAQRRGAVRVISEGGQSLTNSPAHVHVHCGHARFYLARLAARAAGIDNAHPPVMYVTGTDGKSTTVHCMQHCLGAGAARIGTLGMSDGSVVAAPSTSSTSTLTTPAPADVHAYIQSLPTTCPGVAIEVSSHGAEQQRLAGIRPQVVVWTGVTRDHLDYHIDKGHYVQAKLDVIRQLSAGSLCVINADDEYAHVVAYAARCVGAQCVSIGRLQGDIRILQESPQRWRVYSRYADMPLELPLFGAHNAWNAVAAAVAVGALGVPLSTALARLADVPIISGRMELCARNPLCFVDYAHTPHALQTILASARASYAGKKIHLIFGCGGDRDHGKRAAMGTVATIADFIYITNDNPRSEDPASIARDICGTYACAATAELLSADQKFVIELDREQAIAHAFARATADDIIIIAGKGHETEQVYADEVRQWNDAVHVRQLRAGSAV